MNQKVKQQVAAEPEVAIDVYGEEPPQLSAQSAPLSTGTTPIVVAKEPGTTQAVVCFDEEQTQHPAETSVEDDAIQAVDVGKLPTESENIGSVDSEQELEQLAKPPALVTPEQSIVIAVSDTDLPEKSDKSTGPSIDCDQLTPTLSPVRSDTYTDEAQKEGVKSFNDSEASISVIVDDQVSVTATEQNAALVSKSDDKKLNSPPISGEDIATVAKDVAIDKKQKAVEYPKTEDIPGGDVQSQLASESDDSAASSFDEDDQNSSKDSTSEPVSESEKASDNQSNFTTVALPVPTLKKGDNMPVQSVVILDKSATSFGKPRIKKKRSSKRKKKPRPYIELEAYQFESKEETNLSNSEDNCVTGKFEVVSFAGHGSECVLTREMEPPNGSDPARITCQGPIWEFL